MAVCVICILTAYVTVTLLSVYLSVFTTKREDRQTDTCLTYVDIKLQVLQTLYRHKCKSVRPYKDTD